MTEADDDLIPLQIDPQADPAVPARNLPFSCLLRLLRSPAFAYALILLLQLKVVWRAWDLRDLTSGDTTGYYVRAFTWYQDWMINIVWSPLYLAFYGTLMHVTHDVFAVTTLHRLVIVFLATAGVLAVFRRLLPHSIALLAAVWWTILPINFDTLYEVHLFALLPVLAAWLVTLRRPPSAAGGQWCRSICLAILVLSTFLVRNETIVAVGCFGLICLIYEWRILRREFRAAPALGQSGADNAAESDDGNATPQTATIAPLGYATSVAPDGTARAKYRRAGIILFRYSLPTFLALLLVIGAYFRSFVRFGGYVLNGRPQPHLREVFQIKHTLNMAQAYAYGYKQRHPEWDKSPWTECAELSRQTFGRPDPSIEDMILKNRQATLEHFAWNFRLAPAGLQILLFNATSFQDKEHPDRLNPDYKPVIIDPALAVPLSLSLLALVALGMVLLAFRWRYWWHYWLRDRAWGWAAMLAVASTVIFIIPTERPRPSYLFSFSVLLMTIAGMSLVVILHAVVGFFGLRWTQVNRARAGRPVLSIVLLTACLVGVLYVLRITQHPPHAFYGLTPLTVLLAGRALAGTCIVLLILALAGLTETAWSGIRPLPGTHRNLKFAAIGLVFVLGLVLGILYNSDSIPRPFVLGLHADAVRLTGWILAGSCAFALTLILGLLSADRGSPIFTAALPVAMAVILAALIIFVPCYYVTQAAENPAQSQRKLLATYLALRQYQPYIQRTDTVFLEGAYNTEIGNYLGMADPLVLDYSVLDQMTPDEKLAGFLDRRHINLFFLDNDRWSQMESQRPGVVQDLIDHGNADGWRLVGFQDKPSDPNAGNEYLSRWLLFRKAARDGTGGFYPTPAGLSSGPGNSLFAGWRQASGIGPLEGPYPKDHLPLICWGYGPATHLTIPAAGAPAAGGKYKLDFSGMCWLPDATVTVKLDGVPQGAPIDFKPAGTFRDASVPLDLSPGPHELTLEYSKWESPATSPNVKLAVKFRRLRILPDE